MEDCKLHLQTILLYVHCLLHIKYLLHMGLKVNSGKFVVVYFMEEVVSLDLQQLHWIKIDICKSQRVLKHSWKTCLHILSVCSVCNTAKYTTRRQQRNIEVVYLAMLLGN